VRDSTTIFQEIPKDVSEESTAKNIKEIPARWFQGFL
jgi:hypothetical protein